MQRLTSLLPWEYRWWELTSWPMGINFGTQLPTADAQGPGQLCGRGLLALGFPAPCITDGDHEIKTLIPLQGLHFTASFFVSQWPPINSRHFILKEWPCG